MSDRRGELRGAAAAGRDGIDDCHTINRMDTDGARFSPHHAADYRDFSCGVDAYCKRYWIGHYGPRGNHFFAYAIAVESSG